MLSSSLTRLAPCAAPRAAARRPAAAAVAQQPRHAACAARVAALPRLAPAPLRRAARRAAPRPPRAQSGESGEQKVRPACSPGNGCASLARGFGGLPRLSDAPPQPQGFGYTRADAIILSVGIPVAGFGAYAALEARGARTRLSRDSPL